MIREKEFTDTEIGLIPEGWEIKTVSEVSKISLGGTPKTSVVKYWDGDIKWASAKDVSNCKSRYVYKTERSITKEGIDNSAAKILPKDTIVITSRGTVGELALFPEPMSFNQTCYGLKAKENIDTLFLYYNLKNSVNRIKSVSYGTVFSTITIRTFDEIKLACPLLEEQKSIAKILSDLDSKIELLQKQNKTLEAIGQAIFKHWFVDFEFPNEEGKHYKSSGGEMVFNEELGKEIPRGWDVGKLGDILSELESGSRPKGGISDTDTDVPSIGAENILGLGKYNYSSTKYVSEKFYQKMKAGKVKDGDVLLYKDGAKLGRKSMFMCGFPFKKCCINEHVFILRNNNRLNQPFLFFWLDQKWVTKEIRNLNANSAQPGINKTTVSSLKVLIPEINILNNYYELQSPLLIKLFKNSLNIQTISKTRDLLLPKLMSGKIRVPVGVE